MAPPPHYALTFSGVFGSALVPWEIFVHGLQLTMPNGLPATPTERAAFVLAARDAWGLHLGPIIGNECVLTRTRVAVMADDGSGRSRVTRTAEGAYVQTDDLGTKQGSGGSGKIPQVAVAVTLGTARAGRTGRGRFYLPLPDLGQLSQGKMPTALQTVFADRARAFVNAINTAGAAMGNAQVAVASGGSVKEAFAPAMIIVKEVRMGAVPDTIRSRRNAIDEAYLKRPIP